MNTFDNGTYTGPDQSNVKNSVEKKLIAEKIFASNRVRMIVEKIQVAAKMTVIFGASMKNNVGYKKLAYLGQFFVNTNIYLYIQVSNC